MGDLENILGAVEGLHAASLTGDWRPALDGVRALVGGAGVVLEVFDRTTLQHRFFEGMALPEHSTRVEDYLNHYNRFNVRARDAVRQPAGAIRFDQQFISEAEMDRNPFYADFLMKYGLRYCVTGIVHADGDRFGSLAVQMSARQSGIGTREADLLRPLLRHAAQAIDVAGRLGAAEAQSVLGEAIDWLAEGLVVLGSHGRVLAANAAAEAIAGRGDGFDVRRGAVEFADPTARRNLSGALAAIAGLASDPAGGSGADFVAHRESDQVPYAVALRPIRDGRAPGAVALLFLHDPVAQASGAAILQQAFGLTPAEAHLAAALRRGQPPDAYARQNRVSINTVYTHLAHIKDKCGRSRLAALVATLNEVGTPVRPLRAAARSAE